MFAARVDAAPHWPALLDAAELGALAARARDWVHAPTPLEIHEHHAGDWPSTALGRGLDFEEARPYAPGDDLRDMDWRSTARLGHPFIKTYREERLPICHLVLDRTATMRFATRRRLKVAQAARVLLLAGFAAMDAGMAVAATAWDERDLWWPARHGEGAWLELAQSLIAPCPPPLQLQAATHADAHALQRLNHLAQELPAGCHVWLASDLVWLGERTAPALARLAHRRRLRLVRVLDPVETGWPALGAAGLEDLATGARHWLGGQAALNERLRRANAERLAAQDALLQRHGLRAIDVATPQDELLSALGPHG